jgi:serine/threonine protein kinase/outer membrane protein assembly factor BamB
LKKFIEVKLIIYCFNNRYKRFYGTLIMLLLVCVMHMPLASKLKTWASVEGNPEIEGYELLWSFNTNWTVWDVSVSADGKFIVVASGNEVYFLNGDGKLLWSYECGRFYTGKVSISSNGIYVIALGGDILLPPNECLIFDKEGHILYKSEGYFLISASISDEGSFIRLSYSRIPDVLEYYDLHSFQKPTWQYELPSRGGVEASISSDGNYVVLLYEEFFGKKLCLFNKDGEKLWEYYVDCSSISISADGDRIACASPGEIRIIDRNGNLIVILKEQFGDQPSVSLSPDGNYIIVQAYKFVLIMNSEGEGGWFPMEISCAAISLNADYLVAAYNTTIYFYTRMSIFVRKEIDRIRSVILKEETMGFDVTNAKRMLADAEDAFRRGEYSKAKELAAKAYSLAVDVDQDGVINRQDLFPYIHNNLIYLGTMIIAILIGGSCYYVYKTWKKPPPSPYIILSSQQPPPKPYITQITILSQPTPIKWPDIEYYKMCFQNPQHYIIDEEIANGVVDLNKWGEPKVISGRFGCVFKVQCGNRVYAVKCYILQIRELEERYKQISKYLNEVKLPYFVDFIYVPKGIIFQSGYCPILKMGWINGKRLDKFIDENINNPSVLKKLAEDFIDRIIELQKNKIAHGDLHHENIIIAADKKEGSFRIFFVDYDCLYIPSFSGKKAPEVGHPNYQHPKRTEKHYDNRLDNFAALIIYLSLIAIAKDPTLWEKYHEDDCLILTQNDFKNPDQSEVIKDLLKSPSKKVRELTKMLLKALEEDPLSDKIRPELLKQIPD